MAKTTAGLLTAAVFVTLASGAATAEEDAQGTAEFGIGTAIATVAVIGKATTSVLSDWNDKGADARTPAPPVARDPAPRETREERRAEGGGS